MMMDKLKHPIILSAFILGIFGVLGSGLVALTYMGTAEQIAAAEKAALLAIINKQVPPENFDNDLFNDVITLEKPELSKNPIQIYRARKQGTPVAAIFAPVEAPGYAGPIRLIIGIQADGKLGGVRVLSHRETPGLGDKIEESRSDWVLSFSGKSLQDPLPGKWKVKRDGGEFDQFTGATITPRSIVTKTRETLEYFDKHSEALFAQPAVKREG